MITITKTTRHFVTLNEETQQGFFHNFIKTVRTSSDGTISTTNTMEYGAIEDGIYHDLTMSQTHFITCDLAEKLIESKVKLGYTEQK